jgi:excisionase family DNA binding protein
MIQIKDDPMPDNREPEFQTVTEVALDLSVSEKHIRRLMKSGSLPHYMFGNAARIKRIDKEKYQESCRIKV